MLVETLAVLAFSAPVLGRVHGKRQWHHHHAEGTAFPTNFPFDWGSDDFGFGFAPFNVDSSSSIDAASSSMGSSSSVEYITMTVSPIPASTDAQAISTSAAATSAAAAATSDLTTTLTYTSTDLVTVTVNSVGAAASSAAPPESSVDAAPSLAPTSSAWTSATSAHGFAAAAYSSDSVTAASSVAPGGFFQGSSYPFGGLGSATTFATAVSSVVPSVAGSTASAAPVSSTGKKGLSYNTPSLTDLFSSSAVSWAYNWGAAPGGTILAGLEYVPMLWGLNSVDGWASAAAAAIATGSTHLLSFNEPDMTTQSNISPAEAATNHIQYMNPLAGQAQIGSPAITNGVGSDPPLGTAWLTEFFQACQEQGGCDVDFVAFHWYNTAGSIDDFTTHVQDVIATAAANGVSKVWLTEFGATGDDSDVASFLSQALTFLEATPAVERYAYFFDGEGEDTLITNGALNAIGDVYAG